MTSSGRVYFSPLIIFCFIVNSTIINAGKVLSGSDVLCSLEGDGIGAQIHENGPGIFRINVCACSGSVVDLSVVLAESEELCQSSGVHLEWDRNATTIDRRCLLTKPLNFDPLGYPGKTFVLCPLEQGLWNKTIPLQLPYM